MKFITVNKVLKQRLLGAIDSLKNEKENYISDPSFNSELDKVDTALKKAEHNTSRCEFELGWNQYIFLFQLRVIESVPG